MPFPTPDYNHMFSNKVFREHVYEPNEDTFILLDALEKEFLNADTNNFRANLVCEIGTGNGVPGVFLNKLLKKVNEVSNRKEGLFVMMTDIGKA